MKFGELNTILSNIDNLESRYKIISDDKSSDYHEEKSQGEEGLRVLILDISQPDVFLKVTLASDSYGSNEKLSSLQFVTAEQKDVIVYETNK